MVFFLSQYVTFRSPCSSAHPCSRLDILGKFYRLLSPCVSQIDGLAKVVSERKGTRLYEGEKLVSDHECREIWYVMNKSECVNECE